MRRLTAFKMLLFDRSTTAGSVSGVIAIIFLVGQQLAIMFGLFTYMSVLVDNSGADIWITTKYVDNVSGGGTLPMRYVDRVLGLGEVEWAEPIVRTAGLLKLKSGNYQPVQVVGLNRPRMAGGPWRFYSGGLDALLDDEGITLDRIDLASLGNPKPGDILEISNKRVRLSALSQSYRGFEGTIVFTNIDKAREISAFPIDRCSNILVKVSEGADAGAVVSKLRKTLPNSDIYSSKALSRLTRLYYIKNTGIGGSFGFSTLIGALVGVVIIALTMYTSVLNKQKQFAVLRALGARRRDVFLIVLYQALFIAFMGIVAGFTLLSLFLAGTKDSGLPSAMPWIVPPIHAVFTIFLCVAGSLLAMRKAMKIDPASAFR
jgi:putative ABC transport system permease protein